MRSLGKETPRGPKQKTKVVYDLGPPRGMTKQSVSSTSNSKSSAEDALRCSCSAVCRCKRFSVAVNVASREAEKDVNELGVVSCCCDVEMNELVSKVKN